jgi:hypothetical protein
MGSASAAWAEIKYAGATEGSADLAEARSDRAADPAAVTTTPGPAVTAGNVGPAPADADQGPPAGVRGSRIALAGFIFSAFFVLAWFLLRESPSLDSTDAELVSYYGDPDNRRVSVIAGLYIVPLAGIAFIWFMAALRDRYLRTSTRENTILSTAHVVAGALVVTSLFTLAAVELAVVWLAEAEADFDPGMARAQLAFGQAVSDIMALRSAAVFVGVSATRAVRSGLFPRSYGVFSLVTALALLLVYDSLPWVTLLFPVWVAASSALILLRRRANDLAEGA